MMVGRPVRFAVEKRKTKPGGPLMEAKGLTVLNERDEVAVRGVDFTVHEGEIVGIAGVQGNGQTELVEALTGLRNVVAGTIAFAGSDITHTSARERHRRLIAHIPEDRKRSGLISEFTVAENSVLDRYYAPPFSTGITMHWQAAYEESARIVKDFDVRTASIHTFAGNLSGGNQQKLVVGRELGHDTKFLIAAQPTRGIDVGSIEYIHERLAAARDEGDGILIVSTELDEVMSLSDRILVMYRGRIVAEFDGATATVKDVGLAMAGVVS
jgi:simple sugar transport system ATP-binding protein